MSLVVVPWFIIGLAGHVRQRVKAILGKQSDFIYRSITWSLRLFPKQAVWRHVAIRRPIQFGRIPLQRMRAELLNINCNRSRQPLRAQRIEARWTLVRICAQWQPVLFSRFIARDQGLAVLYRRGGTREHCYLRSLRLRFGAGHIIISFCRDFPVTLVEWTWSVD